MTYEEIQTVISVTELQLMISHASGGTLGRARATFSWEARIEEGSRSTTAEQMGINQQIVIRCHANTSRRAAQVATSIQGLSSRVLVC